MIGPAVAAGAAPHADRATGAGAGGRDVVIGGGFLGMTIARRLAEAGRRVTLFEAAPQLGGMADAWRIGPVAWDRHYHVILESDRHLLGLLRDLDLERDVEWARTRTGFFVDGQLHSLSSALEFLRFPPLGLFSKLRLVATILRCSRIRDGARLEELGVIEWLERWSGRATVDKIWRPLLRAKLGDRYASASASFIWAIVSRLYGARRTGAKTERLGTVTGGYGAVLQRYAGRLARAGVEVRTAAVVRAVRRAGDGVAERLELELLSGERLRCQRAIVTLASPLLPRLCSELLPDEAERCRAVAYQGVLCLSLLLTRRLADFYVTNITDPEVALTGIIEMTALIDPRRVGGHHLVYLPRYAPPDDPLFALSDEEVFERLFAGLVRVHPTLRRDEVLAWRLSRVPYVLAINTVGYSRRLPPMATSVPGLFLVSSAHITNGTLNVNETLELAEAACARFFTPATTERSPADQPARA